jgi:uncharacterized SAM-binding protein YcdF (DUF218 family)
VFFLLSKTLDLLLSPLAWVLALLLLEAVLVRRRRSPPATTKTQPRLPWRIKRPLSSIALGLLFFAGCPSVSNGLWRIAERSAQDERTPGKTYDVVIVLGGAVDSAPQAAGRGSYNANIERLTVAYEVLKSGQAKQAILTGSDESEVMKAQLMDWGIAEDRLIVEDLSLNTRQNAVYSVKIVRDRGFQSPLLITSAYHMLRSRECFRAEGLEVDTLPTDFRRRRVRNILPRAEYLYDTETVIHELGGRVIYRVMGYAQP